MESGMQMPLLHGQASGTTTFIWKRYEPVLPAHVENTVKNDDKLALCHQQRSLDTGGLVISTKSSVVSCRVAELLSLSHRGRPCQGRCSVPIHADVMKEMQCCLWELDFPGPREDPILNLRSLGTHCIVGADSGYDKQWLCR